MFNQNNICPYTGLRSFNEEESLYFEGREEQIEDITKLLEKNKFLMVTGASGDGKSSIVYAGIIPNARAGFFKASFPNWVIADFRPEKTPLKNFSSSIATALDIPNENTVETEINRGFSSLIDLYKNSSYYIDKQSSEWLDANDASRNDLNKKGANLMILVDQFEEFFTTQENFYNGVPSQDSQTTMNVILETAKASLDQGLPIYIICTMRSDYIGQCAAFRGLPEFIGFSQFFVPRLKRNQLQNVIEIPASLSGTAISRRLVERLIYDLNEGIDQLPILQHALSQIWNTSNRREEEMDLIHYAMVGGMPSDELPVDGDQQKFKEWFSSLPEYEKIFYQFPSLENVLDIHANRLYERAAFTYNKKYPEEQIPIVDAKKTIALTFASLSRMDDGRGVRNRMTLQEITNIINNPDLDYKKVGRLLNIFREEGNTFIRPFIMTEEDPLDLSPDSVLDITHESLIRNWERLKKWARKEAEYYETFLDFKKQLDKWIESNYSRNYLLPVGPLGYFEDWFEKCQPNAYWINRYQEHIEDPNERLEYSTDLLKKATSFLNKSAKKHFLAKAFMKYGARNLAIAIAIISTILLSSFYYKDSVKKQNQQVINNIYNIGEEYLNNEEKIGGFGNAKGQFTLAGLIHNPDKILGILKNIKSPRLKIETPINAYKDLILTTPYFIGIERDSLVQIIRKNISQSINDTILSQQEKLAFVNEFLLILSRDDSFNNDDFINPIIQEQTEYAYDLLILILSNKPTTEIDTDKEIYLAAQNINNFDSDPIGKLESILSLISPFEETGKINFDHYFPASSNMANGSKSLAHNGGYQLLAEIYAAIGNEEKMYESLEKIIEFNNPNVYSDDETFNNFYQVFGYLIYHNHNDLLLKFQNYVESTFSIDPVTFSLKFIDRAGYNKFFNITNLDIEYSNHTGSVNPVLSYIPPETMTNFFEFVKDELFLNLNTSEKAYYEALFLKYQGLSAYKYNFDRNSPIDTGSIDAFLNSAFEKFMIVDGSSMLDEEIEVVYRYYSDGVRKTSRSKNELFLYPDIFTIGYYGNRYLNGYMIDFFARYPKWLSLYDSTEELDLFVKWIYHGHEYFPDDEDRERVEQKISLNQLETIGDFLNISPNKSEIDMNLLNMLICDYYFNAGDTTSAIGYYKNIDFDNISRSASREEYLTTIFFKNHLVTLASHFAKIGNKEEAHNLVNLITEVHFRMKAYFIIARRVHESAFPEDTYHYIEAGYSALDEFDPGPLFSTASYTFTIIETLSSIGSRELDRIADEHIKEWYPNGTEDKILGKLKTNKYYQAYETLPISNTFAQDLFDFVPFLLIDSKNLDKPKWSRVKELFDRYGFAGNDYIEFIDT
jgi:hypothetical protein